MSTTRYTVKITLPRGASDQDAYRALDVLQSLDAVTLDLRDDVDPPVVAAAIDAADGWRLAARVREAFSLASGARVSVQRTRMLDWDSTWDARLRPVQVGPLWLLPPGERAPSGAEHVLHLDVGAAFGTGLHPTTALCLEYLVELAPVPEILDVGTGSGVLALAALVLGAPRAVATDTDPAALAAAEANARANRLTRKLTLLDTPLPPTGEQFPLVVANILAPTLVELAPELVRRVKHGGTLLLSGIRASQADDVTRVYRRLGARPLPRREREDWVLLQLASPW
ncbi:MAG: 50S ribosomal protein L11 methyltransferase [Myxococcota bacterium]